jgi:phage tail-like protein
MPVDALSEATPSFQYTLYDLINKSPHVIAGFDSLTGGEQEISIVSYDVMDANGGVTTRFMPGQTSFSPVSLVRPIDKGIIDIYSKFKDAVTGKLKTLRRNYSISMNDSQGQAVLWWHLYNAIPIKISGFEFNMKTENSYTDFIVDLQAESIEIGPPPPK